MPSGIQCWDASGNLTIDLTTNFVKFLGVLNIGKDFTGATTTGTVTDTRFTAYTGHTAFNAVVASGVRDIKNYFPVISISGNVLTWTYPSTTPLYSGGILINRPNATIIYGIQ